MHRFSHRVREGAPENIGIGLRPASRRYRTLRREGRGVAGMKPLSRRSVTTGLLALAGKMADSIDQSAKLQQTYLPDG